MSMSLVGYTLGYSPQLSRLATPGAEYKYYPPAPSPNTPPPQPGPQLSMLGSVNGGKLPGPSRAPYGAAIPGHVRVGGAFN